MSKLGAAFATSNRISLAAMEEASRLGLRTADVDHMLLALTLDPGVAGDALRSLGVTLAAARDAVAAQHAEQLGTLGISQSQTAGASAGRIVFHETGGYEWSDSALAIITRASAGKNRGDSAAMLRALVDEPSGMIESVLQRLGTSAPTITARLDGLATSTTMHAGDSGSAGSTGELADSHTNSNSVSKVVSGFIPADFIEVWNLVSDPARIPEWDHSIASVSSGAPNASPGQSRLARARTERPDGRRIRVKPEFTRVSIELFTREQLGLVEWRFSYPDSARANTRRVEIRLEPAADGTRLRLTHAWLRPHKRRSFRGLLLRPLQRLATSLQASQLAAGIGRVFR